MGSKGNLRKLGNHRLMQTLAGQEPSAQLLQDYPPHLLNFALKDLAAGSHLLRARQLFALMVDAGVATEHTLAQLLKGCRMCEMGLEAAGDLAAMAVGMAGHEARRALLTELSLTALVLLVVEAKGYQQALDLLEQLQARGLAVGLNPFNCALCYCAKAGDVDGVLDVFGLLRLQEGVQLDKYTYSAVLRGVMDGKMYGLGVELYDQMLRDGVQADDMLYCQFITCCAYTKRLDRAAAIFEDAQRSGRAPNTFLYNAMLNALAEAGEAGDAQELYRRMLRSPRAVPDAFTYVALLKAGQRSGGQRVADINRIAADMLQRGVKLNSHLLTALVYGYHHAELDDYEVRRALATGAFQAAAEQGVRGGPATYHAIMAMHGGAGDVEQLLVVYDTMVGAGVQPAEATFNLVLRHCRAAGREDKVEEIRELRRTMEFLGGRGAERLPHRG